MKIRNRVIAGVLAGSAFAGLIAYTQTPAFKAQVAERKAKDELIAKRKAEAAAKEQAKYEADKAEWEATLARVDALIAKNKSNSQPNPHGATIYNWRNVGDRLASEGKYKDAYEAYMVRCSSSAGSATHGYNALQMDGCRAARDLRLNANRHGLDTSHW